MTEHRNHGPSIEALIEKAQGTQIVDTTKMGSFLPLELFDPCPDGDQANLLEQYRDPSDGRCYGNSKWVFHDGRVPELRRCEVLEYLPASDYFLIRWLHNSKCKQASRFNVIFDRESRQRLDGRISVARGQREAGDLLVRYHYMIENTKAPDPGPVPDQVKTRVSFRILSHHPFLRIMQAIREREVTMAAGIQTMGRGKIPNRLLEPM